MWYSFWSMLIYVDPPSPLLPERWQEQPEAPHVFPLPVGAMPTRSRPQDGKCTVHHPYWHLQLRENSLQYTKKNEKKTGQSNDGTSYNNYTNCTLEWSNHTWSQRLDSSGFLMYSHVSPPSCLLALSENKLTQNLMSSCSPWKNHFGRYTPCSFRQTQIGDSLILVIHPITSPLISYGSVSKPIVPL